MIELDHVSRYGKQGPVLKDISLRLRNGEETGRFYLLTGERSAGKSTLMELIAGATCPDEGSLRVGGYDMQTQAKEAKGLIGYMPQTRPLPEAMTGWEYLNLIAQLRGRKGEDAVIGIAEACRAVGLREESDRPVRAMSEPERRRLLLAQALVGRPEYLLLDEPAEGLEESETEALYETVIAVAGGRTVLLAGRPGPALETLAHRTGATVLTLAQGCLTEQSGLPQSGLEERA